MANMQIEQIATRDLVQLDEDGVVIHEEHEENKGVKVVHSEEPDYIKLYIQDMLYITDMPKQLSELTFSILKRTTFANRNEGMVIALNSYIKKQILDECGWNNMRTLNNGLSKLVNGNILKRLGTGTYQLNPFIFGRGNWTDIDNIRTTWDYNAIKGRTFNAVFNYKEDSTDNG